jgi:hypothetical protein
MLSRANPHPVGRYRFTHLSWLRGSKDRLRPPFSLEENGLFGCLRIF